MTATNMHGFYANAVSKIQPKKFTAEMHLYNQLIFLEHLQDALDSNTKAGIMVDTQIINLKASLDELKAERRTAQ